MRDIGFGKCKRSWCQTAAINEAGLCYQHADELLTDLAHVPQDPDDLLDITEDDITDD